MSVSECVCAGPCVYVCFMKLFRGQKHCIFPAVNLCSRDLLPPWLVAEGGAVLAPACPRTPITTFLRCLHTWRCSQEGVPCAAHTAVLWGGWCAVQWELIHNSMLPGGLS